MPTHKRVAIVIGGGVVGLCCAISLQRRGFQTTLLSPDDDTAASWGNAGHIAVEQVEPLASLATLRSIHRRVFWRGGALSLPIRDMGAWLPFSARLLAAARPSRFRRGRAALTGALAQALPAWRRLAECIGAPHLLLEQGHFIVWETPASAAAGRASWMSAQRGTATVRDVTPEERETLSRLVEVPVASAVRFEGSGQIADLPELAEALPAAFTGAGGTIRREFASAITSDAGAHRVRLASGESLGADRIVVAAGTASKDLLEPLGHSVPIIAERGYHLQAEPPDDWPHHPPLVFEDRSMIVTRFASRLRAASFIEFVRPGTAPDARKWRRLERHCRALGLPIREDSERWCGARPTLPDYLPAIGRSRFAPGVYYAFGHQHLGLTLAPVTGEAIGAIASGETPPIDIAPFDIDRFGSST